MIRVKLEDGLERWIQGIDLVKIIAVLIPAQRAARIDAGHALRAE